MITKAWKYFVIGAAAIMLSACAWWQADETPPMAEKEPAVSEQEAAYQACLERNQAVAMAWEAIEQSCREEVGLEGDPLDLPE